MYRGQGSGATSLMNCASDKVSLHLQFRMLEIEDRFLSLDFHSKLLSVVYYPFKWIVSQNGLSLIFNSGSVTSFNF